MSLQEVRYIKTGTGSNGKLLQCGVNGTKKKKTLSLPGDVH